MNEKWEKIGTIGVDAGLCWIGDPCYIMHKCSKAKEAYDRPPKAIGNNWSEFCDTIEDDTQQYNFDLGHEGLGVLASTGFGDGSYDVFAQFSDEGDFGKRVKAVKVVFIEDE